MGYKVLKPYLTTRDVLYCPDLPSLLTKKVGASYIWMPVSRSMIPNPTAGEVGLFVRQEREIAALGTRFPLYVCHVHDEAFYQPAEAGIDSRLSQPFILEVSVAGSLGIGRRHYRRINILDGWAMLPSR